MYMCIWEWIRRKNRTPKYCFVCRADRNAINHGNVIVLVIERKSMLFVQTQPPSPPPRPLLWIIVVKAETLPFIHFTYYIIYSYIIIVHVVCLEWICLLSVAWVSGIKEFNCLNSAAVFCWRWCSFTDELLLIRQFALWTGLDLQSILGEFSSKTVRGEINTDWQMVFFCRADR